MPLHTKQNGFTLIELIVVIIILGVLVGIAVPKYFELTNETGNAVNQANIKAIESAILIHFTEEIALNAGYTITDAVNEYNANSNAFFRDGITPTTPSGGAYTVSLDADGNIRITY